MRYLLLIFFYINIFAHSVVLEDENNKDDFKYGIFLDTQYKSNILYQNAPKWFLSYKPHSGDTNITLEHIGAFISFDFLENYNTTFILNRHSHDNDNLNGLVERASISYKNTYTNLELGRLAYILSDLKEQRWGYGFINMPIVIEALFGERTWGDGLSFTLKNSSLSLSMATLLDIYTHKALYQANTSYKYKTKDFNFKTMLYTMYDQNKETRFDSTNIKHSHSHGIGCENLQAGELCQDSTSTSLGILLKTKYKDISLQTEYVLQHLNGFVSSNNYKAKQDLNLHSFYIQSVFENKLLLFGLRGELFSFDQKLSESGAIPISKLVPIQSDLEYLVTFMGGVKLFKYNTFRVEYSLNNYDSSIKAQYYFEF